MRRSSAVALAVLVAATTSLPALAGGNGAQKGPFLPTTPSDAPMATTCDQDMRAAPVQNYGFSIVNLVGKPGTTTGPLQIQSSLKNAEAGHTYDLFVRQGDGDCQQLPNAIHTNGQGNGNAHNTLSSGSPGMYIVVAHDNSDDGNDFTAATPSDVT
jgi:hypothetical protein